MLFRSRRRPRSEFEDEPVGGTHDDEASCSYEWAPEFHKGDGEDVVMQWDRLYNPQTALGIAQAVLLPDDMQAIRDISTPSLHDRTLQNLLQVFLYSLHSSY